MPPVQAGPDRGHSAPETAPRTIHVRAKTQLPKATRLPKLK